MTVGRTAWVVPCRLAVLQLMGKVESGQENRTVRSLVEHTAKTHVPGQSELPMNSRDRRRRELAHESAECPWRHPIPTADATFAMDTYLIEENRLLRGFEPMDVNIYWRGTAVVRPGGRPLSGIKSAMPLLEQSGLLDILVNLKFMGPAGLPRR